MAYSTEEIEAQFQKWKEDHLLNYFHDLNLERLERLVRASQGDGPYPQIIKQDISGAIQFVSEAIKKQSANLVTEDNKTSSALKQYSLFPSSQVTDSSPPKEEKKNEVNPKNESSNPKPK